MIKNFEEKFKELCVEGNRKEANSSSVMFSEEDEYYDAEEMMDEDELDDEEDSQIEGEDQDQQTYFMGTQSQARKRFNHSRSRPIYRSRPSFNRRQSPYYNPNGDR